LKRRKEGGKGAIISRRGLKTTRKKVHFTLSLLLVKTISRALVLVPSGRGTMIIKSDRVWVHRYVGVMPPLPGAVGVGSQWRSNRTVSVK
jgi:hypothetical protein